MYERGDLSDIEKNQRSKFDSVIYYVELSFFVSLIVSMVHHRENVGEFEILVSLLVGLIGLMSTLDTLLTDMGFG